MVYGQAAQSGQITIKDPAEYNDYTNAVGQSTPAAKAAAIEAFLTKYPNSVVKNDLLEQLMATYQQAGDMTKTLSAADRLLAVDPGNLRALAHRGLHGEDPRPPPKPLQPMLSLFSIRPLPRPRPASAPPSRPTMSDADFQKLKAATAPIFDSAIAQDDENKKDFAGAIAAFTNELKAYPDPTADAVRPWTQ